ncbi:MAG: CoA-binding protein [Chloroflexota bacterium]|nr:MAG: CoA-binding protein [Chloroflexota bacterium]
MNAFSQQGTIAQILASAETIAVVGLSSRQTRAGYYVPAYLQSVGYRVIPVNPHITEALGEAAYPDLASIPEPVDLVLIFQRSDKVPPFVDGAIEISAKAVWMQLGIFNQKAADTASAAGLLVVQNACMMVEHRHWQPAS